MHIECVFAWSLAGTKTINAPQRTVRAFDTCDRVRQMQTNTVIQSEKFNSVQILRGLAALLVVIGHTLQHPMAEPPPILGVLGAFGVSIFFVISGFIISYIHPRDFAPAVFLWRRIIRIVPLYCSAQYFLRSARFICRTCLSRQVLRHIICLARSLLFRNWCRGLLMTGALC